MINQGFNQQKIRIPNGRLCLLLKFQLTRWRWVTTNAKKITRRLSLQPRTKQALIKVLISQNCMESREFWLTVNLLSKSASETKRWLWTTAKYRVNHITTAWLRAKAASYHTVARKWLLNSQPSSSRSAWTQHWAKLHHLSECTRSRSISRRKLNSLLKTVSTWVRPATRWTKSHLRKITW